VAALSDDPRAKKMTRLTSRTTDSSCGRASRSALNVAASAEGCSLISRAITLGHCVT